MHKYEDMGEGVVFQSSEAGWEKLGHGAHEV